ncbi:MAG: serine hydrolase, partial [Desulfobacteraceae bacterium]|nr:serine hydrolase [Desulfobacteraceae bacterium]
MKSVSDMMVSGVSEGVFPGAVLLVSVENEIKYFKSFGTSDIFSGAAMQKESIFDLASLTKPLATSMAIFKLIEQKKLSIEQNLSSVIKKFDLSNKSNITIRQLLNHTSGFIAYKGYFKELMNVEKALRRNNLRELIIAEPLVGIPGEKQIYSDLGFIILAWAVEIICGQRIDKFIDEQVYKQLGIDNLFFIDNFESNVFPENIYDRIVPTEQCLWRKKLLRAEVHDDNAWATGGIEGHAGLFGDAHSVWQVLLEIMKALKGQETKILNSKLLIQFFEQDESSEFVAGFDTPSKYDSSSGKYFPD